jgi:hypothetical protein
MQIVRLLTDKADSIAIGVRFKAWFGNMRLSS